jgi:hypothetical protein
MGTRKVPGSADTEENRIKCCVPFRLWYCPNFPLPLIGGKLDKDPQEMPWLQGLYEDIRDSGELRNPLIVWNHHELRGTKQPEWLIRAGSNRLWCCEQLGWETVPAVVSTVEPHRKPCAGIQIKPRDIPSLFRDAGVIWANEHGFGLLAANKPEDLYSHFTESDLPATGKHGGRRKIINPMIDV